MGLSPHPKTDIPTCSIIVFVLLFNFYSDIVYYSRHRSRQLWFIFVEYRMSIKRGVHQIFCLHPRIYNLKRLSGKCSLRVWNRKHQSSDVPDPRIQASKALSVRYSEPSNLEIKSANHLEFLQS
ncbi:hypothetical protein CDAR_571711 [Caerostris darwini]|uniref:Uncharacterized protein n=1 Tax=Caerostris darwini TaxID=1538125 RepID=A0AAV4QE47_9ARAC|nr:hypothetical protein CDAR_571711 [Caerostris darwini]